MIFFIINSNKIINNDNKYLKYKMYLEIISDILNILTFLIYTEIIELNFCKFNYNLRKNIILRGIVDDSNQSDIDNNSIINENEDEENKEEENEKY